MFAVLSPVGTIIRGGSGTVKAVRPRGCAAAESPREARKKKFHFIFLAIRKRTLVYFMTIKKKTAAGVDLRWYA